VRRGVAAVPLAVPARRARVAPPVRADSIDGRRGPLRGTGHAGGGLRVLHLITGLGTGGAEGMLERLVLRMDAESSVVSMRDVGEIGRRIQAGGTPVSALGMRPGVPDPRAVPRLVRMLRSFRPDVVQTWM